MNSELSDKKDNSDWVNIHRENGHIRFLRKVKVFFLLLTAKFSDVFVQLYFRWMGNFEELQFKGDLSDISHIWSVERLPHRRQKHVGEFGNSKSYFVKGHSCAITPDLFTAILKMFHNGLRKTPTSFLSFRLLDLENKTIKISEI